MGVTKEEEKTDSVVYFYTPSTRNNYDKHLY